MSPQFRADGPTARCAGIFAGLLHAQPAEPGGAALVKPLMAPSSQPVILVGRPRMFTGEIGQGHLKFVAVDVIIVRGLGAFVLPVMRPQYKMIQLSIGRNYYRLHLHSQQQILDKYEVNGIS